MTVEGIDISHWQTRTPPLGNLGFVFVKATEGTAVDTMWATHTANVRASQAILGAYHFGRYEVSPAAQAKTFLDTIGPVRLVALDLEKSKSGTKMTLGQAAAFVAAVQATGRKVGLYASDSGFPIVGQDWNWVAKWGSSPPARTYAFWQYASGSDPEVPGSVDRNRFIGTELQLIALAGGIVPPDSSTGDPVSLYVPVSGSGTFQLPAAAVVRAWQPTDQGWVVAKTWSGHAASSGTYDYAIQGPDTPSNLVHCVGGFFDGLYVATSEINEQPDPPAPTYSDGYTAAKKAAMSAVGGI